MGNLLTRIKLRQSGVDLGQEHQSFDGVLEGGVRRRFVKGVLDLITHGWLAHTPFYRYTNKLGGFAAARRTDMTKEVTLRQAGGSVSATLPKDMADRLRLEAGDRVLAVETDRGILLTPYDPDAERALKVAAKAAKQYRNALRELAK